MSDDNQSGALSQKAFNTLFGADYTDKVGRNSQIKYGSSVDLSSYSQTTETNVNDHYLTGYGAPSGTDTNEDNHNEPYNVGYGEVFNYVANSNSASSLHTNNAPTAPSQLQCWTCHSKNWLDCMEHGKLEHCEPNITSCHIVVRKRNERYAQVQAGCKAAIACEQDKNNNFVGGFDNPTSSNQCRPDSGHGPSVCRQCCYSNNCNYNLDFMDQVGWNQLLN